MPSETELLRDLNVVIGEIENDGDIGFFEQLLAPAFRCAGQTAASTTATNSSPGSLEARSGGPRRRRSRCTATPAPW